MAATGPEWFHQTHDFSCSDGVAFGYRRLHRGDSFRRFSSVRGNASIFAYCCTYTYSTINAFDCCSYTQDNTNSLIPCSLGTHSNTGVCAHFWAYSGPDSDSNANTLTYCSASANKKSTTFAYSNLWCRSC